MFPILKLENAYKIAAVGVYCQRIIHRKTSWKIAGNKWGQ